MCHPYVLGWRARWGVLAVAALLAGCGMPSSMEVRTANEPKYEDDHVRFRTTYFFRVFDYCHMPGTSAADSPHIRADSLYRFRMTGKAEALTNDVVFESGTLKSYEIDPFGAAVTYDKANRRFRFQSRAETERNAVCAKRDQELARLWQDYNNGNLSQKLKDAIEGRIEAALRSASCLSDGSETAAASGPAGAPQSHLVAQALRRVGGHLEQAAAAIASLPAIAWKNAAGNQTKTVTVALKNLSGKLDDAGKTLGKTEAGKGGDFQTAGNALVAVAGDVGVTYANLGNPTMKTDEAKKPLAAAAEALRRAGKAMAGINPVSYATAMQEAAQALDEAGAKLYEFISLTEDLKAFVPPPDDKAAPADKNAYGEEKNNFSEGAKKTRESLAVAARNLREAAQQAALSAARPVAGCAPGEAMRRGFQILGPEGFRTFDQDDRLILAMSSSAKPLIAQIKDISGRMLAEQTAPGDALLGLVQARLKVSQAIQALDKAYGGDEGSKINNLNDGQTKALDPESAAAATATDDDKLKAKPYLIDSIADAVKKGVEP